MTVEFKAKPPKPLNTFKLNKTTYRVLTVIPMVGYSPKRWSVEIEVVRKLGTVRNGK